MFGLTEIWSIDIGASAIKAMKLVKIKNQVVVADYDTVDIADFEGFEGEAEDFQYEKIKRALQNLVNRKRLRDVQVAVVLPGHTAMVKKIRFPTPDVKGVERMIGFEAAQQIPFPLEEVVWDYQLLGVSESGTEYEVSLFAIKKGLVNRYLQILKDVQLKVEILQVAPMALYNFVFYDVPPAKGEDNVILLYVGAHNSDLVICSGRNFLIRNIPIGGEDITKAFQRKFSVGFDEAEKIKREITDSKQSQKLFEKVVAPIMNDLVGDMQRTINFFKSQNQGVEFNGIITSGGTFQMPGTLQFLADRFQIGVINIDEMERISVGIRDVDAFFHILPRMPMALGAGLQALGEGPVTVNLLPADVRTAKTYERKRPYAIVALIVVIITLVLGIWVGKKKARFYDGEIGMWTELVDESRKYEADYTKLVGQIEPVNATCQKLVGLSNLLEDVTSGKDVPARYAHVRALNGIFGTVAKFNDPDDETKSIWIDECTIEKMPRTWDAIYERIVAAARISGDMPLGSIESVIVPPQRAAAGGGPQRPGMPGPPGRMSTESSGTASGEEVLYCYLKGRTRQGNAEVIKFIEVVNESMSDILFSTPSGENTVGGQMVSSYTFVESATGVMRSEAGSGVGAVSGGKEQREYMVFKIVWVAKLKPDAAAASVGAAAPAGAGAVIKIRQP
ncbi:MAG: type IV pilus assembly protein PilM [Planctomycetota bacterium]